MASMFQIKQKKNILTLDGLGIIVAALCTAHCFLMPIVLSFLSLVPSSSCNCDNADDMLAHVIFISLSIFFAIFSLGRSYLKHKDLLIASLTILGSLLLCLSIFLENFSKDLMAFEPYVVLSGSLCLAFSHLRNWKIRKKTSGLENSSCALSSSVDCCPSEK